MYTWYSKRSCLPFEEKCRVPSSRNKTGKKCLCWWLDDKVMENIYKGQQEQSPKQPQVSPASETKGKTNTYIHKEVSEGLLFQTKPQDKRDTSEISQKTCT